MGARRLTADVPPVDDRAKEWAFARLHDAMVDDEVGDPTLAHQPRRRWVALVGVLTGLSLVETIAVIAPPPESGGPRTTAARELRRLAEVAAVQAAAPLRDRYPSCGRRC